MIDVQALSIPAVLQITPKRFADARGVFSETYSQKVFAAAGIETGFVQDNQSLSVAAGTVRGLHFQTAPYAQAKLVRVASGRIFDVAVDVRRSSPTFGRYVAAELSAENGAQLLIPEGFAHGFCTLEPNCVVLYKTSAYYEPSHDFGIAWNDPALAIAWPFEEGRAILSDKDRGQPLLSQSPHLFE